MILYRIDWIMMNHVISCIVIINEPRWAHSHPFTMPWWTLGCGLWSSSSCSFSSSNFVWRSAWPHTDRFSPTGSPSPCLATSATSLNLMALGFQLCLRCQNLGNVNLCGYGSIPIDTFLVGWTSIYQLFWGSLGTRVLTYPHVNFFLKLSVPFPAQNIRTIQFGRLISADVNSCGRMRVQLPCACCSSKSFAWRMECNDTQGVHLEYTVDVSCESKVTLLWSFSPSFRKPWKTIQIWNSTWHTNIHQLRASKN